MLTLPIKRVWFNKIKSGEKKEEYREIKPYYDSRFGKAIYGLPLKFISKDLKERTFGKKDFDVKFTNGYGYSVPCLYCKCTLRIGKGIPEWGAEPNKEYYVLEILEILEG